MRKRDNKWRVINEEDREQVKQGRKNNSEKDTNNIDYNSQLL